MMAGSIPNARSCLEVPPRCKKKWKNNLEGHDGVILLARLLSVARSVARCDCQKRPWGRSRRPASPVRRSNCETLSFARRSSLVRVACEMPEPVATAGVFFRPAGVNGLVLCCRVLGIDDAQGPRRPREMPGVDEGS